VIVANFSQLSWSQLLETVLEIVGVTLLDSAEGCVLVFVDATAVLIKLFSSLFNARLQIPVLTGFFEEVICEGDGTKFTMLNAVVSPSLPPNLGSMTIGSYSVGHMLTAAFRPS
jgi:hypothetical protein